RIITPSITAWPPTRVSSPLSSTGNICICALIRRKLRTDKPVGTPVRKYNAKDEILAAMGPALRPVHNPDCLLQSDGNRLNLGVLLQAVLAQFTADARLLEAAERRRCIEHVVAVHPYCAC